VRLLLLPTFGLAAALVVTSAVAQSQTLDGKTLYLKNCRSCHGTSGSPTKQALRETPKIRALEPEFLAKISEDSVNAVVANGIGKDMKPFKAKLSGEEIQAIARYVKTELGVPKPR
jgi:mono/diheme cytochrome c family protein